MSAQTLKPSDIRIGNLIANKYIDSETVYKVKAIKRHQINTDHGKKYIRSIVGIPLTEEWLLRFGFNYDHITAQKGIFEIGHFKDGFYLLPTHNIDKILGIEIKYVHQLQNLFYCLTGEELEIKI